MRGLNWKGSSPSLLAKIRLLLGRCEKCWNYTWTEGQRCVQHQQYDDGQLVPMLGVVSPPMPSEDALEHLTEEQLQSIRAAAWSEGWWARVRYERGVDIAGNPYD